jgi:hypothetical protein
MVVVGLTGGATPRNLNFMQRLNFAVLASFIVGSAALAQDVPARELLEFPIGTIGAPGVLFRQSGHGLWNPATIAQARNTKLQVGVATLNAPADQGVNAQLLSIAMPIALRSTVAATVVRASINDLLRTDTDPQSLGAEIPYNTTVASLAVARRTGYVTAGLATRLRFGQFDGERSQTLGLDGGVIVHEIGPRAFRAGASTFLWGPGKREPQVRYSAGADMRLFGRDTLRSVRGGYAYSVTQSIAREHYFFGSARFGILETLGGFARVLAFQHKNSHARLGVGLHYARYIVGVGREDNGAGMGATYQFMLSSIFR